MRLPGLKARIRVADELFYSGDDLLLEDIEIEIAEGARTNTCRFSIYDKDLKIGGKFQAISFAQGGILVPPDLLESPTATAGAAAPVNNLGVAGQATSSQNSTLSPRVRAFLDVIAHAEGAEYNSIFGDSRGQGSLTDLSRHPNRVVRKGGYSSSAAGRYQFLSDTWNELRQQLNLTDFSPATQDLAAVQLLRRRGALQNVEAGNFEQAITQCNREWASLPGSPYGQPVKTMAELRQVYDQALQRYQGQTPAVNPMPPAAATPAPTELATAPPIAESSYKGTEVIVEIGEQWDRMFAFHFIQTGCRCDWGSSDITTIEGKSIRWLLTRVPQTRAFENMNLGEVTARFASGFNLRLDVAAQTLPTYQHLDMSGQTPFQLLEREASAIGFTVSDSGNTLRLHPAAEVDRTNQVIDEDLIISATFNDQARAAGSSPTATVSTPTQGATASPTTIDRATGQVAQTQAIDPSGTDARSTNSGVVPGAAATPVTGTIQTPATGSGTSSAASSTGAAVPPGEKVEEPARTESTSTVANGVTTDRAVSTRVTREAGKITTVTTTTTIRTPPGVSSIETRTVTKIETTIGTETTTKIEQGGRTTESTTKSTRVNPDVFKTIGAAATASTAPDSDRFGLPKQPAGAIDLADGRAEPAALVEEAQRSKGFASEVVLRLCDEVLAIVPGQLLGLSGRLFPPPFNREWRVGRVRHTFKSRTSSIEIYTPQASLQQSTTSSSAPTTSPTGASPVVPGKMQNPTPTAMRGTAFDPAGRIRGRPHMGIDTAGGSDNNILAAEAGRVTFVGTKGGFGQTIIVEHSGAWQGYETLYAHLSAYRVQVGQTVTRGQVIGIEGSTGRSSGDHLHFEVKRNGTKINPEPLVRPCFRGVYGQGTRTPLQCRD